MRQNLIVAGQGKESLSLVRPFGRPSQLPLTRELNRTEFPSSVIEIATGAARLRNDRLIRGKDLAYFVEKR